MIAFSRSDEDGVVTLTLDVPGERLNILSASVLREFREILEGLESAHDVKGVVICSGKPDGFVAGADIKDFVKIRSALEGETLSREGQTVLDRVQGLPMPVVVAVHGACLGGGLELALACRYRIASRDPKTVFGLPEVKLGLIPGAGGSQRLPRLVGLATSLDLIVSGRTLRASRALAVGLVDELVAPAVLLRAARACARRLADGTLRPRRRGISLAEKALRSVIFGNARRAVVEKTGGHYPAPLRAIEVVDRGTARSLPDGLKLEAETFGALAVSGVSRALVSVFFATQEIKKDPGYPAGTPAAAVSKLAVIGAGLMGSGIAAAAAEAGLAVRLRDTGLAALGHGLRRARDGFEDRRRRGSLSPLEVDKRMDRIAPTTDGSGLRRASLVIEAVHEELEIKRKVLAEAEAGMSDEAVFASNTSALPICEIARDARGRHRVLGMHFFSPVDKMPLVEVVVTNETADAATATAVGLGRRLGKHVIVVRDGPGFYTSRVLAPYLNEAARLVEEGAAVEAVDAAAVEFGFPVGPMALLDEVGIDVGAKVAKIMHERCGERMAPPASMARVVADGRMGRKNGRGFYTYGRRKRVDASVYDLMPAGPERRPLEKREIQDRLAFAFLVEAVLCLDDGVLRSPVDGDVGAIFGLGFPAFTGGPFRYLDHLGARFAAEVLERLQGRHGARFAAPPSLLEKARSGGTFHRA